MTAQGMYEAFPIERIVYGRPAAAALATEADRINAQRVFLLVSRTLRQETDCAGCPLRHDV